MRTLISSRSHPYIVVCSRSCVRVSGGRRFIFDAYDATQRVPYNTIEFADFRCKSAMHGRALKSPTLAVQALQFLAASWQD